MVYGHILNNTNADFWPLIENSEKMLNAGVDVNHFKPVTFDEMVENNKELNTITLLISLIIKMCSI